MCKYYEMQTYKTPYIPLVGFIYVLRLVDNFPFLIFTKLFSFKKHEEKKVGKWYTNYIGFNLTLHLTPNPW